MGEILDFNDAPRQSALTLFDPKAWEARVERVRAELVPRASAFVREIFPSSTITSDEARIGSLDGEPGASLSITLSTGLWFDHATGQGGDLIDLYRQTQRADFPTAIADLERFLGLTSAPAWTSPVHKLAERRRAEAKHHPPAPDRSLGVRTAVWHYLDGQGNIYAAQERYELSDGSKDYRPKSFRDGTWRTGAPAQRILYRLPDIISAPAGSSVIITEGEKCADALSTLGYVATTAMGGANAPVDKTDWTPLLGKTVLLWPDNDEPGFAHMGRVRDALAKLGIVTAEITIPPGKPAKWDAADAVSEEIDVVSIIEGARPAESAEPRRGKYQFIDVDELEHVTPVEWLIEGVAPKRAFIGLYGPSGGLKSFVAVDIALSVATGRTWHGCATLKGGVIYIAGEGKAGLGKRVVGWRRSKSDAGAPVFKLLPSSVAVSTGEELDALIPEILALNISPALIILDTLARNFGPGDENSQKDMNAFVRGVDRLIEATGAAVLVVHHTGKDDTKGERGSSAFRGALDTSIFVKRKGRTVTLINKAPHGKQKDAEEFEDIHLAAATVAFEMGGVEEKTLVLTLDTNPVQDEGEDEGSQREPFAPRGARQKAIISALEKAAKQDRALSLNALVGMTGIEKSNLSATLRDLTDKGVIERIQQGEQCSWKLA